LLQKYQNLRQDKKNATNSIFDKKQVGNPLQIVKKFKKIIVFLLKSEKIYFVLPPIDKTSLI
jgi:hypothetical protein